jgi:hypothetical protein
MVRRLEQQGGRGTPWNPRQIKHTGGKNVASAQKGGERGPKQKVMAMVKAMNPNQDFRKGERTI